MSGNGNCPTCHAPLDEEKSPHPNHVRLVCRESCGYVKDVYQRGNVATNEHVSGSARSSMPIATPGLRGADKETTMDYWMNHCHNWGDPGCGARYQSRMGVPVRTKRRAVV